MRGFLSLISLWFTALGCTTPMPLPSVCGDGVSAVTEECDDGNTMSGDGCSATCSVEIELDAALADGGLEDVGAAPMDASGVDAPATDVGPLPDGAVGAACGARSLPPCAVGLDCVFTIAAACGASGGAGTCEIRPTACTRELAPVCGCDGLDYSNECEAHRAGTSAAASGECPIVCDPDLVTCDGIPPRCVAGSVPRVVSGCWDGCVPLGDCTCSASADCPGTATCDVTRDRCGTGPAT